MELRLYYAVLPEIVVTANLQNIFKKDRIYTQVPLSHPGRLWGKVHRASFEKHFVILKTYTPVIKYII